MGSRLKRGGFGRSTGKLTSSARQAYDTHMELQVELIKAIQQIRSPFLDIVFQAITMTAEELFFIVLAAWFLWCGNKQLGYRVGFAFLASAVVNPLLKNSFRIERPVGVEGIESQRLHTATGFAFPSGHTQGATAFWTGMMTYVRRRWMYLLGTALIVLVAFSRMYLGVHWPSDVIGGVAAGVLSVLLINRVFDFAARRRNKLLLLLIVLPLGLGLFLFKDENYVKPFGSLLGFWLGYVLEDRYIHFEVKSAWWLQVVKLVAGLVLLLGIRVGLKSLFGLWFPENFMAADLIRYFVIGLWLTAGAPYLFNNCIVQCKKK